MKRMMTSAPFDSRKFGGGMLFVRRRVWKLECRGMIWRER
jgi:hypothetical protein